MKSGDFAERGFEIWRHQRAEFCIRKASKSGDFEERVAPSGNAKKISYFKTKKIIERFFFDLNYSFVFFYE